ncbi:MAG: lytic transglycosylase domain-containing protein [Acidobacteriota bacterium]|nr:lytic transglycosylase domain-containing protein [Acidobacteriota bacterium]
MAAGLRIVFRSAASFLLALLLLLPAASPFTAWAADVAKERDLEAAARAGKWTEVLERLAALKSASAERYQDGRFDYLEARARAATGDREAAIALFERHVAADDLLDVPARLAAGSLRFENGDGLGALELLFPLLQRKGGAVSRRALRIALDALETRLDVATLNRLVAVRPPAPARERRRLLALRAEALDESGDTAGAAGLREDILREARRDDAAAVVLAREIRGKQERDLPDRLLPLLIETAKAQRDLDLAERLAVERDARAARAGRAGRAGDGALRWGARFDLGRILASRGRFAEAATVFRSILDQQPRHPRRAAGKKDDAPGTDAFFARARFNLGAVLEKLGQLDAAAAEFRRVENGRVGPAAVAALQRARLLMRRRDLAGAEAILMLPRLAKEPGRVEGLLHLLERHAEAGDGAGARRILLPLEHLARSGSLKEPWKSELPFWRGRVAEASGDVAGALAGYAALLAARPYTLAGELATQRMLALPAGSRDAYLRRERLRGEVLLTSRNPREARVRLLPPALLGDSGARDLLRLAYRELPGYAEVLLAPDLPEDALPTLCGDAAACRLLQLGLPLEAEPIVRDASRLATLLACLVAARLAEDADAGPAALDAAEALDRMVPDDFLLDLAPRSILRGLAPRPFGRLVAETADQSGVPRDLLYAVMRQESRFDREAASPAAARGLMQLTLPAAGDAARELNETPPAYADLYDPARSLRLGARTLKNLLARFDGDAVLAASGYNAGAGQTALWSGGAKSPAEALLASISYPETRTYVRRVLANRILYRKAEPVTAGK